MTVDPVRSRLAASVAAAAPRRTEEPTAEAEKGGRLPAKAPRPAPPTDRLTVHTKVMMTPAEAERNVETTAVVRAAFGSKVTVSQITRAMWSILAGAEEAIQASARRAPRLPVPSKGDHRAMAEYEDALAEFIETTLKRS